MDVKFNAFGLYAVTLKVTNATGTDQKAKTAYINVVANSNRSIEAANTITVFPNPATDKITVKGLETLKQVILTSVNGQVIAAKFEENVIDLSGISAGVYFATITDQNGGVYQTKFIVNP
jgi:PKD repeat protein